MLTQDDIDTINAARTVLDRLAAEAASGAWRASNNVNDHGPYPASYGRMAERCEAASDALFQVLNGASAYLYVPIEDADMFNREIGGGGREPDGQRIEGGRIVPTDR